MSLRVQGHGERMLDIKLEILTGGHDKDLACHTVGVLLIL